MKSSLRILGCAVALMVGCATSTDSVEGSGETLVRKADYEGRTMYYNPSASPAPLSEPSAGSVPVQVRFYDGLAVAYRIGANGNVVEQKACAVAAWETEDVVLTRGTVRGERDDNERTRHPQSPIDLGLRVETLGPGLRTPSGVVQVSPIARLDWLSEVFGEILISDPTFHPGCQ